MSVLPSQKPARHRVFTPYVLLWVVAAGLATAYLALLGLRPEIFASAGKSDIDIAKELAETKRDVSRAFADLDPVRSTVGEMKLDVANLKVGSKEIMGHVSDLNERVTALENSAAKAPEVASSSEPAKVAAAPGAAAPPKPKPDPRRATGNNSTSVAPASQGGPHVINGNKSAGIETGSIDKKPKAKPKAASEAGGPVGVLLATGPSVDSLRLNWTILNDRHADAVKSLKPRYVVSGKADKRVYSLVAGPVASREQARSLCREMTEKGLACEVSIYRGNAL